MNRIKLLDRFRGCLIGLAVGDAVGTAVEFHPRGSFPVVEDMIGGGPFNLKPGQWTDDTSMALCLSTSLIEQKKFDPIDQMDRYLKWYEHGYLSSTGHCFDIGNTVSRALLKYKATRQPFCGSSDPKTAGNGSLMRLAPISLFYFQDKDNLIFYAGESSRTTHGADECISACRLFSWMLNCALMGKSKENVLGSWGQMGKLSGKIADIASGNYKVKAIDEIRGSGYVVASLEAALWSFYQADDFRSAILKAVNLGEDTDTTAAICGQIAGAFYGLSGIPESWKNQVSLSSEIIIMADQLLELG